MIIFIFRQTVLKRISFSFPPETVILSFRLVKSILVNNRPGFSGESFGFIFTKSYNIEIHFFCINILFSRKTIASFSTPCHVLQVNSACVWSWSYSNPGKKNMWWRNFILTILPAIFKSCYLRIAPIPHEALAGAQHFPKYLSTGQSWFENTAFFFSAKSNFTNKNAAERERTEQGLEYNMGGSLLRDLFCLYYISLHSRRFLK